MTTTTVHVFTVLLPFSSQRCELALPHRSNLLGVTCQMGQIALHISCPDMDADSEPRLLHIICGNVGQIDTGNGLRHVGSVAPHMIMHAVHVFEEVQRDERTTAPPPVSDKAPTRAEKRRMN